MHPEWLSNAYLAWDEDTREAFFVDSGAPLDPLLELVEEEGLHVRALLTTHTHHDHVAGDDELHRRFGVRSTQSVDWAQSIPTPASPATCSSRTRSEAVTRRWCASRY